MTNFYKKIGSNLFTPETTINSILLDNSGSVESTNNGIEINLSINSKDNFIDSIIDQSEYLQYTKLTFIVSTDNNQTNSIANLISSGSDYNPTNSLVGIDPNVYTTTNINISDYVQQNEGSSEYSGTYQTIFRDLKNTGNLSMLIIPWIDFASFADDNSLDQEIVKNAIKNIYKNEINYYTILNKNNIPTNNVVNDARNLTEFKNTLLTLFPITNTINFDILNKNTSNQQYFENIYESLDYTNKKIKLFSLFNIKEFVKNFACLEKSYFSLTNLQLENIFRANPIVLNISKTYSTTDEIIEIGSISFSLENILSSTVNAQKYNSGLPNNILFSFEDDFPESTTEIQYNFEILFSDPLLRYYYTNETNSTSLYATVVNQFNQIQSRVNINNPNISDAKTGKFTRQFISSLGSFNPEQFINNFIKLLNLFTDNKISQDQTDSVIELLNIQKSNIFVFIDLYSYITKTLFEIENIFLQIKNINTVYNKTFSPISVQTSEVSFGVDTSTFSNSINNLTEQGTNNTVGTRLNYLKYDNVVYSLKNNNEETKTLEQTLIKNSLASSLTREISFSTNFSLTNTFSDINGLTLKDDTTQFETKEKNGKQTVSIVKTKTENVLLNKSFNNINSIFNNTLPSDIATSNPKIDLSNSKFNKTIQETIDQSKSEKAKEDFLYSISTSSDAQELAAPEIILEFLIFENNKLTWKPLPSTIVNFNNYEYLTRKTYLQTNNLFSKLNTQPIIENKYEVIIPSTSVDTNILRVR